MCVTVVPFKLMNSSLNIKRSLPKYSIEKLINVNKRKQSPDLEVLSREGVVIFSLLSR